MKIPTEPDTDGGRWRYDERDIDGGFCGCEYPRLWPPRRHEESEGAAKWDGKS